MRCLAIFLLLGLCFTSQGQVNDSEGLELLHRARRVTKTIPFGEQIILRTEHERVRGVLMGVGPEYITVDGKDYRIRELAWISQRTLVSYLLASGLAILGLGMATTGVVSISDSEGSGWVNGTLVTVGAIGVSTLSYSSFRNGRRIYLDSEWKIIPPEQ